MIESTSSRAARPVPVPPDVARERLAELSSERRISLAQLSAAIRRNPAYLQQYVARGTPKLLAEQDRRILAAMLGVEERELGGPVSAIPADPLREEIATELWETSGDGRPWCDAGDYWQAIFLRHAEAAVTVFRRRGLVRD